MGTKLCEACKKELPVTDFYFRKESGKYRSACKKCKSVNTKEEIKSKATADTKVCKHCGVEKPVSEYQKAGGGKWNQPYCKPCDAERKRRHLVQNKDIITEKRKQYYEENKEMISEKTKTYRSKNIKKIKERSRKYSQANSEKIKQRNKEYGKANRKIISSKLKAKRDANPEYYKAKAKAIRDNRTIEQKEAKRQYDKEYKIKKRHIIEEWRKKNADKVREQRRIWGNKKAATDIVYRIKRNLRTRIRCALKPNNAYKSDGTEKLLGCTVGFFKIYLESLFTEGMNWDKFMSADIEIDHIKPCAKFDLTQEEEQRKCFHYTNCQPLWWYDNNKKGSKYNEQKVA